MSSSYVELHITLQNGLPQPEARTVQPVLQAHGGALLPPLDPTHDQPRLRRLVRLPRQEGDGGRPGQPPRPEPAASLRRARRRSRLLLAAGQLLEEGFESLLQPRERRAGVLVRIDLLLEVRNGLVERGILGI